MKTVLCRASLLLQLRRPLLFQAALALLVLFLAELSRASLLLRNHLLLAVFGETFALLAILFLFPRLMPVLILLPILVLLPNFLLLLLLDLAVLILLLLIIGALLLLVLLLLPLLLLLFVSILLLLNLLLLVLIAWVRLGRGLWSVRVPRPLRLLGLRLGMLLILLFRRFVFVGLVLIFVLLILLWVSKSSGPKKHEQSCRAENCNAFHWMLPPLQTRLRRGTLLCPFDQFSWSSHTCVFSSSARLGVCSIDQRGTWARCNVGFN